MKRFIVITGSVVFFLCGAGAVQAQTISVCSMNYITTPSGVLAMNAGSGVSGNGNAASFTVSEPCVLTAVGILLNLYGSPTDSLNVYLESASGGGSPSNTVLDTGSQISVIDLSGSFTVATSTFSGGYTLEPSTTYFIEVNRSQTGTDNSNYAQWGGDSTEGAPAFYQYSSSWISYTPYGVYLEADGCTSDCSGPPPAATSTTATTTPDVLFSTSFLLFTTWVVFVGTMAITLWIYQILI